MNENRESKATIEQLLESVMGFKVEGKPMFKALTYHSNGKWSADYRTWSKDHRTKFRNFADTPQQALIDLYGILAKVL